MELFDWFKSSPPIDVATKAAIERAVTTVEPLIRLVRGYQDRLAPAVQRAMTHCDEIAEGIPGPFEISRSAFVTDPMVHALFGSVDDIETMLARSQCLRDQWTDTGVGGDECCALLGVRHREKSGFGAAMSGEIVRLDVPQRILYFTDHTLAEPSSGLDAALARLRLALFDGILKGFAAHLADVRAEHADLSQTQAIERARVRGNVGPESHTRRLDEWSDRLRAGADALQPEALLETLTACLAAPEPFLRVDPVTVSVDRMGVITGMGTEGAGDTLHFVELTGRDKRRWVVMLARIQSQEARRAIERAEAARRYIVI